MIHVLLVDDQPLARAGLRMILDGEDGIVIAGECDDGAEAVSAVQRMPVGVVLMDVRMRGMDGIEATRAIRALPDAPPVLILTTYDDDEVLSAALHAGIAGFALKSAPAAELIQATRAVAAGDGWLDVAVTARVLNAFRTRRAPLGTADPPIEALLTAREREVLRLLARGMTNQEIANDLSIGTTTVKSHVGAILDKLDLRDRAAAIVYAYDHGLVEPTTG